MAKTAFRISSLQLLVFPMAFLVLQILLKIDYKWFFLSAHDPAYAFLFNGLNIAQGNFELGLSGFPGTTLQCLIAINLKIFDTHSATTDLAESVLQNPEYFLNIVSWEIVALNTLALFLLGFLTFRRLNNLTLSLGLQLTPFISLQAFNNNSVVMLEPLMLCINLLLLVFIANFTFNGKRNFSKRDIILMAILMALGVSTKTVFIPVILLPLFAIKGFRNILLYFGMIFISLTLFLIPIYPTFSSFMSWYITIFTHTGSYGTGNYDLFDLQVYLRNMKLIFSSNVFFTVTFLLVIVGTVIIWIPRFRNAVHIQKRSILSGIAAVYILNILMVAKHFSSHYLYISYNLVVFAFILMSSMIPWPEKNHRINITKGLNTGIVYIAGVLLLFILVKGISFSPCFSNPRLRGVDFVNHSVGSTQRIIILEAAGPFIETALFHGLAYSAGMKSHYAGMLKKYWPSTYFYNIGADILHDWIHEYNLVDVLSKSPETYIYFKADKDTLPNAFLTELPGLIKEGCVRKVTTVYRDTDFREYIYKVESDVIKTAGKIIPQAKVVCDFEKKTPDDSYFMASDSSYLLSRANLQSNEISLSGNSAVKLFPEQPYGPGIKLPALRGYYKISVMRQSSDGIGLLVASDTAGTRLYKSNGIPSEIINGWELVELVFNIPETLIGESINLFLWYPGKENCYFDNLEIRFYSIELPNFKVAI